jgi:hypothetical protein
MMGASICYKIPMNIESAASRVLNMQSLQWAKDAKSALTAKDLKDCSQELEKLHRIGSLEGNAWKSTTPQKTCHLVHAYSRPTQGISSSIKDESPSCYDNTSILVDTFEDKFRIGASIDFDRTNLLVYVLLNLVSIT